MKQEDKPKRQYRRARYNAEGVRLCSHCDNPVSKNHLYCKDHLSEANKRYKKKFNAEVSARRDDFDRRTDAALTARLKKLWG